MMITNHHIELFWAKVDVLGPEDCWEWMASILHDGYGNFSIWANGEHKSLRAHRFAWLIGRGPIPDNLLVCHHCDNRRCVNPSHLFVGTHADNQRDAAEKGRLIGRPNNQYDPSRCTKLTDDDVLEIKDLLMHQDLTQAEIGERFGVHQTHISRISRDEQWKWVRGNGGQE